MISLIDVDLEIQLKRNSPLPGIDGLENRVGPDISEAEFVMPDKDIVVVGSGTVDVDFCPSNTYLAAMQFSIVRLEDGYFLQNMDENHGTFLNDKRLNDYIFHSIKDRDSISIGSRKYRVRIG